MRWARYSSLWLWPLLLFFIGASSQVNYLVNDMDIMGRRYDGIGAISGGGATSKLFFDYPKKQQNELLDYLFKPNFGASLQILKVEIGGDAQSTEGTEASHMHERWDENYNRGYEWKLMVEAKKRNPAIKLVGLPWGFPGWLGNGTENPYQVPGETAMYVVKWISGAKKYYNLTIDYVGIWNERPYSKAYIEVLRAQLDSSGFSNVQIIGGDGPDWKIANDVMSDPAFAASVGVVSAHYPGTTSSVMAVASGKPVWASEDYSTFDNAVGGGCLARILNQNYVNGFMTSTLIWNLVASYYNYLPYMRNSLINANEPWGGHYEVVPPLWVAAHTTQFAQSGWQYLGHGVGVGPLEGGGSYVSLTDPDRVELTIIAETMSHDMSVCVRPPLKPYVVKTQDLVFEMDGSFKNISSLHVWKSELKLHGSDGSKMMQYMGKMSLWRGRIRLANVPPNVLYTITTVSTASKGHHPSPPPSTPFPLPYFQNFASVPLNNPAPYLTPQVGSFEIQMVEGGGGVGLVQTALQPPIHWCSQRAGSPVAYMGAGNWSDIHMAASVFIPKINGTSGAMITVRTTGGGCSTDSSTGIFFRVFPDTGMFRVSSDYGMNHTLANGTIPGSFSRDKWYTMEMRAKGKTVSGSLAGTTLFSISGGKIASSGHVGVGSHSFGRIVFGKISIDAL